MRTPPGGSRPWTWRWKWGEECTSYRGTTPVVEDLAGAVDVGEERLERPDPLLDAGLEPGPLGVRR